MRALSRARASCQTKLQFQTMFELQHICLSEIIVGEIIIRTLYNNLLALLSLLLL